MVVSVWGGSYGMHVADTWALVPTYITAAFTFTVGLIIFVMELDSNGIYQKA